MANRERELSTLDFLRSVAVLLVVANHLLTVVGVFGSWVFRLGRLGVYLFFVHTCYVLMMSLQRMRQESEVNLWTRFMVRRCFRIYPLAVLALAAIVVLKIPTHFDWTPPFRYVEVGRLAIVSNFLLTMNLTRSSPILQVLWSLPYEMDMYLLLPALYLLTTRWTSIQPALLLWVGAVAVACIRIRIPHTEVLSFINFVPYFLAGTIAFQLSKTVRPRLPFWTWPIALAAVIALFCYPPHRFSTATDWFLVLGVGFMVPHFSECTAHGVRYVAHAIAKYSYGIYIGHMFCLSFAFQSLPISRPAQWVVFLCAIIVLPVVLYHGIEQPMIRLGRKLTLPTVDRLPKAAAAEA
jgi:peptidoglycan/LPS O-acetylase OafA/YrhL